MNRSGVNLPETTYNRVMARRNNLGGRPLVGSKPRSSRVIVLVEDEIKQLLERRASLADRTLSDYVRDVLVTHLARRTRKK